MNISGVLRTGRSYRCPSATRSKRYVSLACIVLAGALQGCASDQANTSAATVQSPPNPSRSSRTNTGESCRVSAPARFGARSFGPVAQYKAANWRA